MNGRNADQQTDGRATYRGIPKYCDSTQRLHLVLHSVTIKNAWQSGFFSNEKLTKIRPENPCVAGSIPAPTTVDSVLFLLAGTHFQRYRLLTCGPDSQAATTEKLGRGALKWLDQSLKRRPCATISAANLSLRSMAETSISENMARRKHLRVTRC